MKQCDIYGVKTYYYYPPITNYPTLLANLLVGLMPDDMHRYGSHELPAGDIQY